MSACIHCGAPLDDAGRAPIHLSGQFRCETGESWAEPMTEDSLETLKNEAFEAGVQEGISEAEQVLEDETEHAHAEGVKEGRAEIREKLSNAIEQASSKWLDYEGVRQALASIKEALEC